MVNRQLGRLAFALHFPIPIPPPALHYHKFAMIARQIRLASRAFAQQAARRAFSTSRPTLAEVEVTVDGKKIMIEAGSVRPPPTIERSEILC